MAYNGKTLGSANMAWGIKNLDIPATLSLMQVYQTKLQPYEEAAAAAEAAGEPAPQLQLNEAEQAQVKAGLEKLLAAKPQVALENLSFKTANGESRMSLVVDLTQPQSLELPSAELGQQLVAMLDFNLQLSKPMIADVVAVQAQVEGLTDAKAISEQANMTSEMIAAMALGTELATLEGTNIVSKLHYTNREVTFNGQKMTVDQFVGFLMSKLGGVAGVQ